MHEELQEVVININKAIMGQEDILEYLLVALLSEGHVLLEGLPGVGKTKLALALSKSLQAHFKRVQFTPDVLPSDITGYYLYNRATHCMDYREGVALCHFLLADEINRASPRVQSSLLEAMEEKQVTVEGKSQKLPTPFMVIATQNAIENEGTYPLPEAQLDRFFMKLQIDYPKREDWKQVMRWGEREDPIKSLEPVMSLEKLNQIKEEVKEVVVAEAIYEYVLDLVQEMNKAEVLEIGINPRGSIALLRGAKAWAYLQGRNFVLPDDVKKVAHPILVHRMKLKGTPSISARQIEHLLTEGFAKIKVPISL